MDETINRFESLALRMAETGTFYLNNSPSSYREVVAEAWREISSFEDFFSLVTSLVEMNDACIECLGYETPEDRLYFLFHQGEAMKEEVGA